MEKVTAYKAFNGKLFDNEKKCLEYEAKLKAYPKQTEEVEQIAPDFFGNQLPIYKHTIKRKERYNEPTRIKEFYEVRHGENSYYVLGGDSMIFGLTHEKSLLGCNIMSMVGYYIAKLIMDGENPFGESFFDNLQNNILYWNENEIERKNRYTNTERIAMERTIVDNGAISFTFPNAHGAFDTFVADVTNNKEYVFKRLKIG